MVIWNIFGQGYRKRGRKGTFDGRYGCRKCFCVTFDKSNKTAVSGEYFFYTIAGKDRIYVPCLALVLESGGEEYDDETNNQWYDRDRVSGS